MAKLIFALFDSQLQVVHSSSGVYFSRIGEYVPKTSALNTMTGNLTNGKTGVLLWSWENGRIFQNIGLFMLGFLAGRKQLFINNEENKRFWIRTLIIAAIAFIVLYIISQNLGHLINSRPIIRPTRTIINSLSNFSFMLILLSGFILVFRTKFFNRKLNFFSYMGRMSMTNYIMQSIMGSFIYYGFGLGMYKYTGATYCLLIGIGLAIMQFLFSYWWIKSHKQGPLETIWHKGTWMFNK